MRLDDGANAHTADETGDALMESWQLLTEDRLNAEGNVNNISKVELYDVIAFN